MAGYLGESGGYRGGRGYGGNDGGNNGYFGAEIGWGDDDENERKALGREYQRVSQALARIASFVPELSNFELAFDELSPLDKKSLSSQKITDDHTGETLFTRIFRNTGSKMMYDNPDHVSVEHRQMKPGLYEFPPDSDFYVVTRDGQYYWFEMSEDTVALYPIEYDVVADYESRYENAFLSIAQLESQEPMLIERDHTEYGSFVVFTQFEADSSGEYEPLWRERYSYWDGDKRLVITREELWPKTNTDMLTLTSINSEINPAAQHFRSLLEARSYAYDFQVDAVTINFTNPESSQVTFFGGFDCETIEVFTQDEEEDLRLPSWHSFEIDLYTDIAESQRVQFLLDYLGRIEEITFED